jgi:hypothetical protein
MDEDNNKDDPKWMKQLKKFKKGYMFGIDIFLKCGEKKWN